MQQLPAPYSNTEEKRVLFELKNPVQSIFKLSRDYPLIPLLPVCDLVILVCKWLPPKTAALCACLSRNWYNTISSGEMKYQFRSWLLKIEYPETSRGPYIDFCIAAAVLTKQLRSIKLGSDFSLQVRPYSLDRIVDESKAVTAAIYLNRIGYLSFESVVSVIEKIKMPRKQNIAWYSLADEFLKRKDLIKAKEIAQKHLMGTPYQYFILNQMSL